jgi:uncharacterized protein YggE
MTGEAPVTVISVRGVAQRMVEPDSVVLSCFISSSRQEKPEALEAVSDVLEHLRAALGELGGVPLTARNGLSELTWSAHSIRTHVERDLEAKTGRTEPTGRVVASVDLHLAVRDFGLLQRIGSLLAEHPELQIAHVAWLVDRDNAAWPAVRAEAIHAAVRQARHYAEALGGSLSQVEQIADVGLLGASQEFQPVRAAAAKHVMAGGDSGDVPSLDPVPQTLTATVDARFVAFAMSIDES